MNTELKVIDARILDLMNTRLFAFLAPMETCNKINDEIHALRIERARIVEAEDEK